MQAKSFTIKQYVSAANLITMMRMLGAIALFFLKPLELPFFIVYSFCGVTDAVDGVVARRTNTQSKFGAKLDSASDLVFYAAMLFRLLPRIREVLPWWVWIFIIAVLVIRAAAYLVTALKFKKFSSRHTVLNKATSAAVFFCPYVLLFPSVFTVYALIVCAIGTAGSVEELIAHLRQKPDDDVPSSRIRGGKTDAGTRETV